jgi:hypothetical protein
MSTIILARWAKSRVCLSGSSLGIVDRLWVGSACQLAMQGTGPEGGRGTDGFVQQDLNGGAGMHLELIAASKYRRSKARRLLGELCWESSCS